MSLWQMRPEDRGHYDSAPGKFSPGAVRPARPRSRYNPGTTPRSGVRNHRPALRDEAAEKGAEGPLKRSARSQERAHKEPYKGAPERREMVGPVGPLCKSAVSCPFSLAPSAHSDILMQWN